MTETEISNLAISLTGGGRHLVNLSTDTSQDANILRRWFAAARDEALSSHPWNFAMKQHRATVSRTAIVGVSELGGKILISSATHDMATGDRVHIKDVAGVPANGTWYVTYEDDASFTLDGPAFSGSWTPGTGTWLKAPLFDWGYQFDLPADCLAVRNVNGGNSNEEDSRPYEIQQRKLLTDCDVIQMRYTARITDTALFDQAFVNAFALLLASCIAPDIKASAARGMELRQQYEGLIAPKVKGRDARQGKRSASNPQHDSDVVRARRGFSRP